ncbi:MAG: protein-glutamate O-methyltransferase [Gammaproteobacteria bacterium]|nr:protein-glutamate O-methyltransferase [Gammaproteobacteria bacterium]
MSEKQREFAFSRRDFNYLREVANSRTGIVVADDKFDMFYARLSRRVRKLGLRNFSEYCELIKSEPEEIEVLELVNAITTNLTSFFREQHHFEELSRRILPELIQRNGESRTISIWSAGCSTGEEPYSIAMTIMDALQEQREWRLKLLATDIDSAVLQRAESGVYPAERVQGIPTARLRRWFLRGTNGRQGMVRVKPELQRSILFRQLNLLSDWALEQRPDVIFCRNVIIYFDKLSKQRLIERFASALNPGGYLFIGHSESLFNLSTNFELVGNTLYRHKG